VNDRAADLDDLDGVEANQAVLEILRSRAGRRTPASSSPWDIDDFVLHSHPDLSERLEEVGTGLPGGGRYAGVCGHAALIDADRVIRVVVMGNAGLAIRVRDETVRADIARNSRFAWSGFGPDWVGADPWPRDLSKEEGTVRLRAWLDVAFAERVGGAAASERSIASGGR
jgi:hypothetical protein